MVPLFLCYSPCCSFSPTGIEYSFNRPCQPAPTTYPPFNLSSIPNIVIDEFPTSKRYLDLIPHREGNESFSKRAQNQADWKEYAIKQSVESEDARRENRHKSFSTRRRAHPPGTNQLIGGIDTTVRYGETTYMGRGTGRYSIDERSAGGRRAQDFGFHQLPDRLCDPGQQGRY